MNLQLHLNGVYLTSQTHKFRFLNSPKVKAYSAFLQKNQDVLIDQPCLTGEQKRNIFLDISFEKCKKNSIKRGSHITLHKYEVYA